MAKLREPGEITAFYGLAKCSACGEWMVKAKPEELLPGERAQLAKLGLATVAAEYRNHTVCTREQKTIGLCVEH